MDLERSHDYIKFTSFGNAVRNSYKVQNTNDEIEKSMYSDKVAKELSKILIKNHFGRWIEGYISLCIQGYIRTIAYAPQSFFMRVFTVLITFLYFLGLFLFRKNKEVVMYILMVLLSILGTVLSTSLVIMCMTRYMVYNFVVFYTGFIIMWCNRKNRIAMK